MEKKTTKPKVTNETFSETRTSNSSRGQRTTRKVRKSSGEKTPTTATIPGIGASMGRLEAVDEVLENMPPYSGMAFVVVTHQHPIHTSLLPKLLRNETEMQIIAAADGKFRKVECARIANAGGESPDQMTLTLLTDQQGHPEAIAMMTKQVSD